MHYANLIYCHTSIKELNQCMGGKYLLLNPIEVHINKMRTHAQRAVVGNNSLSRQFGSTQLDLVMSLTRPRPFKGTHTIRVFRLCVLKPVNQKPLHAQDQVPCDFFFSLY